MSTATATTPISASVFLFGDGEEGISALATSLDEQGVLGSLGSALSKLSGAGLHAVGEQIATVAHGLLDLDLGDLLTQGWRRFDDLTDAARRTVENPGSREVVDLVTHTISSTSNPHVELLVDEVRVATLGFDLDLGLTVKGAVATVYGGRMVALHTGVCDVVGSISAQGRELVSRQGQFRLPLVLGLGSGIPLLIGGATASRPMTGQVRTSNDGQA